MTQTITIRSSLTIYIEEEVDSLFNGEFYKWLCHYVTLASNINLFGACTSLAEEGSVSL